MNSLVKDLIMISLVGAAGAYAYKCIPASKKRNICNDFHRTAQDVGDVREDMTHMASTIKDTF